MSQKINFFKKVLLASVFLFSIANTSYSKDLEIKENNISEKEIVSKIKGNMHTFQTMVETYAIEHNGIYPKSATELLQEAKKLKYYKNISNPFGKDLGFVSDTKKALTKGILIYIPIRDSNCKIASYEIFANLEEGKHIKDKNGEDFYLSND